jgi:hypothetical protein
MNATANRRGKLISRSVVSWAAIGAGDGEVDAIRSMPCR